MTDSGIDAQPHDFVIVRLDDEYFAFDVAEVAEVLPFSAPVRMPRAPKFLVGVVDVRGHLLPVVDLRLRAELSTDATPRHILAVRLGERVIGASVDEVCEIYAADATRVSGLETLEGKLDTQYVRRALRWGQRLVPVMDAERLLTTDETLRLRRLRHKPRRRRGERK